MDQLVTMVQLCFKLLLLILLLSPLSVTSISATEGQTPDQTHTHVPLPSNTCSALSSDSDFGSPDDLRDGGGCSATTAPTSIIDGETEISHQSETISPTDSSSSAHPPPHTSTHLPTPSSSPSSSSSTLSSPSSAPTPLLYVISVIFNPKMYTSRIDLFEAFDRHMASTPGVVHITVECIFPSQGQTQFTVTQANNPNHYQLTSISVLWVKEDLINYAVRRLPPDAEYVAWIDADVTFHQPDWPMQTIQALNTYAVVQMFQLASFLGPNGEVLHNHESMGYATVHKLRDKRWPHPGYGWATRRSTFAAMRGLPDFHIVGNADQEVAFSFVNRTHEISMKGMNEAYQACSRRKQFLVYDAVLDAVRQYNLTGGTLGYAPLTLSHHWHGAMVDRHYEQRKLMLLVNQFNPDTDLEGFNQTNHCPGHADDWGHSIRQLVQPIKPSKKPATNAGNPPSGASPSPNDAQPSSSSPSSSSPTPSSPPVAPSTDRSSLIQALRLKRLQADLVAYFSSRKENDRTIGEGDRTGVVVWQKERMEEGVPVPGEE